MSWCKGVGPGNRGQAPQPVVVSEGFQVHDSHQLVELVKEWNLSMGGKS